MGKQVRFFMNYEDEVAFHKVVIELEGTIINQNTTVINSLPLQHRKVYIRFPQSQVLIGESGLLDVINSDVIEYVRCLKQFDRFSYGRIWTATKEGIAKEKWFNDKYNKLSKWIKNTMSISESKDFYIAEGTLKDFRSGIKMMATPTLEVDFK